MGRDERIERTLRKSLRALEKSDCPPKLHEAIRHAVFPGGARVRPALTLAVATACGDGSTALARGAAAAVELIHCASLVHDDLPCFDDAEMRRGLPSVHRAYGEALAVLVGDALIVQAFELLAGLVARFPQRAPAVLQIVARGAGGSSGIIAGQAWESESTVDVRRYQRVKTGALFEAAILAGAAAAGDPVERWRNVGRLLGEAYQIADDFVDVFSDPASLGKPVGQDRAHARPSIVRELDIERAMVRLNEVLDQARDAIPACGSREALCDLFVRITTASLSRMSGGQRGVRRRRGRS